MRKNEQSDSHSAIMTRICLYVWNSKDIFWYHTLPENVSEINPQVKDKNGCKATRQSRSYIKTE